MAETIKMKRARAGSMLIGSKTYIGAVRFGTYWEHRDDHYWLFEPRRHSVAEWPFGQDGDHIAVKAFKSAEERNKSAEENGVRLIFPLEGR